MKPIFIAGPCSIESAELLNEVASKICEINRNLGVDIIFKASFDKANRTSLSSYRGVGLDKGLQMLSDVKSKWGLKLCTDIHESWQAAPAGEVIDVVQIPAFLCRQTDLLVAAAQTGRIVNIKKAQFLSGEDMIYPYEKAVKSGAKEVWLTERGNIIGYNDLAVDFRNIPTMQKFAPRVLMDCTHAVQRPGAGNGKSEGNSEYVPAMALAAKAFGANGYFFETHPTPEKALSDAKQQLTPEDFAKVIDSIKWRAEASASESFQHALLGLREQIDSLDREILKLLAKRMKVAENIGRIKRENDVRILQSVRWESIAERTLARSASLGLSVEFLQTLLDAIHVESINHQNKIMKE